MTGLSAAALEDRWQRRAWIVLFVTGALAVIAAPINLLGKPPNPPSPESSTGLTPQEIAARIPGIDDYISSISRQLGNFMLAFGVLLMGVAAGPFRRGERWAWNISWSVPLVFLIQLLNSRGGWGWQFDLGGLAVVLGGLLVPYRRFFPKHARG